MSLFNEPSDTPTGDVSVYIKSWHGLHLWYVIYEHVPLVFDKIGVSFSFNAAKKHVIKAVQRIIRYENKEKTR